MTGTEISKPIVNTVWDKNYIQESVVVVDFHVKI